jgi:kynurenine formamidase
VRALLRLEHGEIELDLSRPHSLAVALDFCAGRQPRHFGASPATTQPYSVPGFSGSVALGASCNCNSITLIPHCNTTHTESVAHLTTDGPDAYKVAPFGLIPAVLVSVQPVDGATSGETSEPAPKLGDLLITRGALQQQWPGHVPFAPRAVIVRTLPNEQEKRHRDYTVQTPPFLSQEAARWLAERAIEHLIVDLPSIDRTYDDGRLTAHRAFFGLPSGSRTLHEARRAQATITELAYIPDTVADGPCLIEIQVPAIAGDAVPSRPLLYELRAR